MESFYVIAPRIIFFLGIVNLLTGLLVFFSCRCLPGSKIGAALMQKPPYKSFYKWHCHLWKVFWPSVLVHTILALTFFGWPG